MSSSSWYSTGMPINEYESVYTIYQFVNSVSVAFNILVTAQRLSKEEQKRNQNEDSNKKASEQKETSKI